MRIQTSSAPQPIRRPAVQFNREDGSYQLNRKAFEDAYVGQVQSVLSPAAPLKIQGLQAAYALARQLLGPAQALALGGEAMASLVDESQASDLDAGMRNSMKAHPVGQARGTDVGVYLGEQSRTGYGASTTRSVILPEGFASLLPHPLGAFLVGHELGHVEHNDIVRGFGRRQVLDGLRGTALEAEAQKTAQSLEHEAEFAADQRGVSYALAQGHTGSAVLAGFTRLLQFTDGEASSSHPGSQERLERLKKLLSEPG